MYSFNKLRDLVSNNDPSLSGTISLEIEDPGLRTLRVSEVAPCTEEQICCLARAMVNNTHVVKIDISVVEAKSESVKIS